MMYKHRHAAPLVMIVLLLSACIYPFSARTEARRILVLRDADGDRVSEANLLEIERYLSYSGLWCDYADAWVQATLDSYDAVIVVMAEGRALNEKTARALREGELPVFVAGGGAIQQLVPTVEIQGSIVVRLETETGETSDKLLTQNSIVLMEGENAVLGGTLFVGDQRYPLCKTTERITHLAYCDASDSLMAAMLATFLQAWMWPYHNDPTVYGQYLVLDQVYPFYEPADLMAVTDMLMEEGVPYAVSVMPVYANADYPAMKRFCEWLRYIQSKGACIVLHAPLVTLENVDMETYKKQLNTAFNAYSRYGVYPLAIEAPEVYLFSKRGLEAIQGFRTVVLYESDEQLGDRADGASLAWHDGHQVIAPYLHEGGAITTAYAQAIYLNVNEEIPALRGFVQALKRSQRVLKSLTDLENSVYVGNDYVNRNAQGVIEVNGELVDLTYEPFQYEEYKFQRGLEEYLTSQIETSNKLIMAFVLVAGSFFAVAIVLSRRAMKRDILHQKRYQHATERNGKARSGKGERG